MVHRPLLVLCLCALSGMAGAGQLYKSIGPDGRVIYSDHPPVDARVQKAIEYKSLPASPLPDAVIRYRQALEQSAGNRLKEGAARGSSTIQLFAADWCGYCRKAKAWLADKGIAYREFDIDTPEGKHAFSQTQKSSGGIPLLVFRGEQVQGFSARAYEAFFARHKP